MTRTARSHRIALALACVVFCFTAVVAIGQLAGSDRIERAGGCGFDGAYYCGMLKGAVVPEPFSRRILLPFLAKRVDTDGLAGFWVVSILSLVAVTLVGMFVAWRLRLPSSPDGPIISRIVPPLLVGAMFLSARNTFHLTATYPALSDPLGLLLFVGAVALVVLPTSSSTQLLLVPVCFLAPLAREELAPVLALALLLAAAMRLLPWLIAIASSAATAAGAVLAFSRPNSGSGQCLTASHSVTNCPESIVATARFWLDWDFGSWDGFFRFAVMLILAFGPFVWLLGTARPWTPRSPSTWILAVAAIFTAASIIAGGDTDRILTPAGLLVALALAIRIPATGWGLLGLSSAVLAWVILQDPLHAVGSDDTSWLSFFGLRVTDTHSVVHNGLIPALIALPVAVGALWLLRSSSKGATASKPMLGASRR